MPDRHAMSLSNLQHAVDALRVSATTPIREPRDLSGVVKDFEIAYELAWKALKRTLETAGHSPSSARDAFALGYQLGWLDDEQVWLGMIADRQLTMHTYNEALAQAMLARIRDFYVAALTKLMAALQAQQGAA